MHVLLKQYGEAEARFEHAGGYTYEQTTDQVLIGLGFKREDYECPAGATERRPTKSGPASSLAIGAA